MSQQIALPSDLRFGLLMATVFAVISGYLFWTTSSQVGMLACASVATLLLLAALARPRLLRPLNHLWMSLGELMGRIINPVILGLIFFFLITPVAWLMRRSGRDPMHLRSRRHRQSYWVDRIPPGPDAASFKNQF